ncbi:MipA/OmpV family protein [Dyella sp. A6]|uniref:MipA/OmpV family protein n=1 Tax=Dyella aluminiiresistens TaxID=3069105 RepID=UPI002E77FD81|nr:MipA/OmpV family protein [Dyella sp. A6]
MKKIGLYVLMTALPLCARVHAQSSTEGAEAMRGSSPQWQLGVGVISSDHAYAGSGSQITPIPLVDYEGKRFFFREVEGGVHLWKSAQRNFTIDAIIAPGFNNINANEFSRDVLARRGINRDDLDNRYRSIDVGLAATIRGAVGQFHLEAKSDVSGNSKGPEFSLQYGYPMQWGRLHIEPSVSATFLSSDVANYYYGIHRDEIIRGVPGYQPGGALIPAASVSIARPVGAKWVLMFNAKVQVLPSKIKDSPLVDRSYGSSVFVGIARKF